MNSNFKGMNNKILDQALKLYGSVSEKITENLDMYNFFNVIRVKQEDLLGKPILFQDIIRNIKTKVSKEKGSETVVIKAEILDDKLSEEERQVKIMSSSSMVIGLMSELKKNEELPVVGTFVKYGKTYAIANYDKDCQGA